MNSNESRPQRARAIAIPKPSAPVSIAPRPPSAPQMSVPSNISLASTDPVAVYGTANNQVQPADNAAKPLNTSMKTPKRRGGLKKKGGAGGKTKGGASESTKGGAGEKSVSTSPVSSHKTRSSARRLTDQDVYELIRFWGQNFNTYERTGAKLFSKKAAEHLNLRWIPTCLDTTPVTPESIETKLRYLTDKYRAVVDKMSQSGFGNEEKDPPSLAETKRKLFKFYDDVHTFLGSRSNNVPDLVVQFTRKDGVTEKNANTEYGKATSSAERGVEDERLDGAVENERSNDLEGPSGDGIEGLAVNGETDGERRNSGHGNESLAIVLEDSDVNVEPRGKKRKIDAAQSGGEGKYTQVVSEGRSGTRKSLERVSFAKRITENSALFAENAQKSLEKSLEVMEKDVSLKEKELLVLERTANIQEREVKTREREVDMKGAENLCNQLKAQEHALREQAAMFRSWGDVEEAKKCMKEARELVTKIAGLNQISN